MSVASRNYVFPTRTESSAGMSAGGPRPDAAHAAEVDAAFARGYQAGLTEGRAAASAELEQVAATIREQAAAAGLATATTELEQASAALRAALDELATHDHTATAELEAFGVELALAAVAQLVETDELRAAFVRRAIAAAVRTLAPAAPRRILLNPADYTRAGAALADLPVAPDETVAPGAARVDGGRLLVDVNLASALAQMRTALSVTQARRARERGAASSRPTVRSAARRPPAP